MTDITARVIEIVAKRTRRRVTSDAILSDLDLCPLDQFFSIPTDVEEEFGLRMLTDAEVEGLTSIQDIISTVHQARIAA